MKNRIVRSALALMMMATMIFSDSTVAGQVHATEDATETVEEVRNEEEKEEPKAEDQEPESQPEPQPQSEPEPQPQPDPKPEPEPEIDVDLYASTQTLSFGIVYEGEDHDYQVVTIYNYSDIPVNIYWNRFDSNNAFYVDAPDSYYMPVNGTADFYITPKETLPAGRYSAGIYVGSEEGDYESGVEVEYSIIVEKRAPYVDRVEIIPTSASVTKGSSYQFDARAYGGNNPDTSVRWSLSGAASAGTAIRIPSPFALTGSLYMPSCIPGKQIR